MPAAFCYDRRESYFDGQDCAADNRYAVMRYAGRADISDLFQSFSRIMRPKFSERTRRWGLFGMAKPKNSKPRRKDHRA